jgi:division/cell wall cluster transcriptional repressor MraZ
VDAKHRLTLPTVFRGEKSELQSQFFVGVLLDSCIYLFTESQHHTFLERIYSKLGDSAENRLHKTVIVSRFTPVTADANGRITIPGFVLKAAKVQKEVILISQKTRVEIWGVETFEEIGGGDDLAPAVAGALEAVFAEEEQESRDNNRGEIPG